MKFNYIIPLIILIFASFACADLTVTNVQLTGFLEDNVTGTITITNTGNTTVTNVNVAQTGFTGFNFLQAQSAATSIVAGGQTTYKFTVLIPVIEASILDSHSIGNLAVSASGVPSVTSTVSLLLKPRLEITKVTIEVDGDSEKVSDGETIDVKRGDSITLEIDIENQFSSSSNNDINNIDITVENNDLDIDESDELDLDSGDEDTITFSFSIDDDADDGTETVEIIVDGYDDNNVYHKDVFEFRINVDVPSKEVLIKNADFSPSIVTCDKTATLNIDIKNTGSRDLDDAMIIVESDDPDFDFTQYMKNIAIDEGDTYTSRIKINLPEDIAVGYYLFNVKTYYGPSTSDDSDDGIVNLEVAACKATTPTTTTPPTTTPNAGTDSSTDIVVTEPARTTVPSGAVFAKPKDSIFQDTQTIVLLVLVNLIIIGIIIGVTAAIVKKNN